MVLSPDLLWGATHESPWDNTSNVLNLTVIPTYISLITKRGSLLENKGEISAQVTEALKMDLDGRKIGGG